MRIGVYIGGWRLTRHGGMGVYLRNLLQGVAAVRSRHHDLMLLVGDSNRGAATALDVDARVVDIPRPSWSSIPARERRRVIRVRQVSYASVDRADAMRRGPWSQAAREYLWGLDDAVRDAGIDLLYFPIPPYVKRPRVPVLLTIHDLKHLHRPCDHDRADLARRRRWMRVARRASLTYASFEHIREDIVREYGLPRERTAVLPPAVPGAFHPQAVEPNGDAEPDLPEKFALMPAQFWPHKNHIRVVRAIASLRETRELDLHLVCTGRDDGEYAACAGQVRREAARLGVDDLIHRLGYVDESRLRRLYAKARMIVIATLYDPGSFPAMEALAMGKPLAASRVTSIPETVGDAAVLFDPTDVQEMARALEELWTNDARCELLATLGPSQLPRRNWSDVAREWLSLCERAVRKANEVNALPCEAAHSTRSPECETGAIAGR